MVRCGVCDKQAESDEQFCQNSSCGAPLTTETADGGYSRFVVGFLLVIAVTTVIVLANKPGKSQHTVEQSLTIESEPLCNGWGIKLTGTVSGGEQGRSIKDVTVTHNRVGTYPERTFTFVDDETGHLGATTFTTWLPDKSGPNTFPAGKAYSVNWTITVTFNGGGSDLVKSGTYKWSAMCGELPVS